MLRSVRHQRARIGSLFRTGVFAAAVAATAFPSIRAQTLLGELAFDLDGGALASFNATPLTLLGYAEFTFPPDNDPVFSLALANGRVLTAADAGFTFTMNPDTPGFADLAALLTNGQDDMLFIQHAGGGFGQPESAYWTGEPRIDLMGSSIATLEFTFDSFFFETPSDDPTWTDYRYQFRLSAYSASAIPEPSTYALFFGVAAGLAVVVKRRAKPRSSRVA